MKDQLLLSTLAAALVGVLGLATTHNALSQDEATPAGWTAPRTPWGEPDVSGLWPTGDWRGVPMQRDEKLGLRNEITPEEFAEREARAARDLASDNEEFASDGGGNLNNSPPSYWQDRGVAKMQASLIVDPPNGRLPATVPGVQARVDARNAARQGRGPADSWTDRSLYERCISRGMTNFLPTLYNNGNEILQSPGYVIIRHEMINETRMVPISDKPFSNVRSYMGESRGRWEGDTLVVETRNYLTEASNVQRSPVSDDFKMIERFTRVGDHKLRYEATFDDPGTWVQPWTIQMVIDEEPWYELYEYACHEGNYGLENILKSARYEESVAAGSTRATTRR